MTHNKIERDADEAYITFWKRWHSVNPSELRDIGEPTSIEVWHHSWRAAIIAEREACAKLVAPKVPRPCDCESCDCGNKDDAQRVAEWDAENLAATAIRLRSNAEITGLSG